MKHRVRGWWRRAIPFLPVALASALICGPRPAARADDKSDLLYKIEGKLKEAASQLGYLANDSGERPIDYARGYVDEARRYASDLKGVAGDDSTARNVAEYFDRYYDAWDDASNDYLRPLKGGVGKAEPTTNACKARDRELSEKAEQFRRDNNPDGLTELPRLAEAAKDATRRELDELRSHDSRQADYASRAQYFSADGPWRDLDSAIDNAARDTLAKWRTNYEAAKTACERVDKGLEHPVVKEVLAGLSSSAGGRKAIIEQLNRDARDLASTLAGVSEDSGTGSVQRAKALVASIKSGLDTLARTATTDAETKTILARWPEGVRQMEELLDDLEDLKVHQHDMDPLPDRCAQKDRELADAIARNGDDPDGIDELPKLADQLGEPVRAGLAKADERLREENDDLQRAKAMSVTEGALASVRDAVVRDADETHATFVIGHKKTAEACANIVKGAGGPIVSEAVKKLRERAASSGDSLDREVVAWVEAARATYILDCKKMETLWEAYCGTDFEPGDDSADDRAKRTAAQLQGEMQSAMGPLLTKLEELRPKVTALIKKKETRARGEALLESIKKEQARLTRLQGQGAWRANNHPLTQFAKQYGNDRHKAEWRSRECMVPTSDTAQPEFGSGAHTKPDCIFARDGKCEVWEFKPDSPEGRAAGPEQVRAYAKAVPNYYNDLVASGKDPDDAHGGAHFMKALKANCYNKERNEFTFTKVDAYYYEKCDKQYVCEQ